MSKQNEKNKSKNKIIPQGKEESSSGGERKRQCTPNPKFMVPGSGASPPKFLSLEEIMAAANGLRDMALVHQIVFDDNFKLVPVNPPENSLEKRVKEQMTRAFWDLLKSQLAKNPPEFTLAMTLLEDIRQGLFNVLLPQHTKIKEQINEVLDADLIRQQAEKGTLDFNYYAQYTVGMMAKLCAPIRDEKIKELTMKTDVIETFKGILETLQLMALDMANFAIEVAKPEIIKNSVEFEKKKFAEMLKVAPEPLPLEGLDHTKKWISRHIDGDPESKNVNKSDQTAVKNYTAKILGNGYMELFEWDNKNIYPETLMLDELMLKELAYRVKELIVVGSILLVTFSTGGLPLQNNQNFKDTLKRDLFTLISSLNDINVLKDDLPSIADTVVKKVKEALQQQKLNAMSADTEKAMKAQIVEISQPEHKIKNLIQTRVMEFIKQVITSTTANPQQVPPGLSSLQRELAYITGKTLKIISHNRAVYSEYYIDIVASALK